jgi:hypothetical protein
MRKTTTDFIQTTGALDEKRTKDLFNVSGVITAGPTSLIQEYIM